MTGTAAAAEAKVMRAIVAREHKRAQAERREARTAFARSKLSQPSAPIAFDSSPDANRSARTCDPGERERQRIEHLVLGHARPPAKSVGKGRAKRKIPVPLDAGVDAALKVRESWSHKQGTPETHERAARSQQGSLARLYRSGAIDGQQLDSAAAIAAIAERIAADVNVRTASLETRVDRTRTGDDHFFESLGRVRAEIAYTRWRAQAPGPIAALLELIVEDRGIAAVAQRHRIHHRKLRRLLLAALDLWPAIYDEVRQCVGRLELDLAHAAVLS